MKNTVSSSLNILSSGQTPTKYSTAEVPLDTEGFLTFYTELISKFYPTGMNCQIFLETLFNLGGTVRGN